MSFFKKVGGALKDYFTQERGRDLRTPGRMLRNLFDPRNLPYLFGISDRSPWTPPGVDLTKIRTDEDARDALDAIIGVEDTARKEAEAIAFFRDQGGFAQRVQAIETAFGVAKELFVQREPLSIQGLPFTADGDARLATGQFAFDPIFVLDQDLLTQLEDPATYTEYMRLTKPQELLTAWVERDLNKVGKDENVIRGIMGNVMGNSWDVFTALFTGQTVERLEEAVGQAVYQNAIPDPYLRQVFASQVYERGMFNFWDPDHVHERDAMMEVERITAEGLTGEASAQELEKYFQENPLGGAGFFANMVGWALIDPLWFFPFGKVGMLAAKPLKGITAGAPISRLLRIFTPTGRRAIRTRGFTEESMKSLWSMEGAKAMARMPRASYAAQKAVEPNKGILRLLFERPPQLFADQVGVSLERVLTPVQRELARTPQRISEIGQAFRGGERTAWVREALPNLTSVDENMMEFAGRVADRQSNVFDDALGFVTKRIDEWEEVGILKWDAPLGEIQESIAAKGKLLLNRESMETFIPKYVVAKARAEAERMQRELWESTPFGKFLVRKWFPWTGAIKTATAGVALSTFGFIHLNVVSNFIRMAWDSALHPQYAFKGMGWAMAMESDAVLKGVGRGQIDHWARILRPTGLGPENVESFSSRITGSHDIFARTLFEGEADAIGETMEQMWKVRIQPGKEVGVRSRLLDKAMWPVHVAGRVDKFFRRTTFMSQYQRQVHMALAPGGRIRGLFFPVGEKMRLAGRTADEIATAENVFADKISAAWLGPAPWVEEVDDLGGVIAQALNDQVDALQAGTASAVISPHGLARRFVRERFGITDPTAEVLITKDFQGFVNYAISDVGPVLDDAQKVGTPEAMTAAFKKIDRMLETYALDYDVPSDIVRQMARQPSVIRGPTTYAGALRVTDQAIRKELADNVHLLDRFIGIVKPGWSPKEQTAWYASRQWARVAESATTENIKRLDVIRAVYNDLAKEGIELVSRDTIVPPRLVKLLPEDMRPAKVQVTLPTGKKVQAVRVGDVWDSYLTRRDASFDEMFSFVDDTVRKSSEAHAVIVARIGEHVKKTFAEHRKIISEALEVGDDDAWRAAGEKVRQLYEQSAPRKAKIAGLGVNDVPAAQQFMDPSGVLASEIHEFKGFFMQALRDDMVKLQRGELKLESGAIAAMRDTIGDVQRGWAETRDLVIANSRAATDFTMLNYLDQRGIDRLAQSVFPFEFWPTRDVAHWVIRGARAPGAFGTLTIAMFETEKFAEQYGYPQRLQHRIPILIPGAAEWMDEVPGLGNLVEGGDFSPIFWIDPFRFLWPMTFMRDQFDDEARRRTLPGRVLDFFQNSTPLNVGPFQMFAFRQVGLLDKDAWRSTYLSGGPFGIPLTPAARATARFVFTGDTDAIPEDEQYLYLEKGHFSPAWLADLLGLGPDPFALWRADRAMASLVATGELIPGAPPEEQLQKAWIALDTRKGPEWKKAVKASQAETNLRRITHYIGFPFGDVIGVNEGERIWFGLKAIYGEYARRGKIEEFFEKYPEFELRTATVRGLSDPKEREAAVDTELYYQSIEHYVEAPFEKAVMDLENERSRLQKLTQSQEVRDQITVLNTELRAIRDEQDGRREELDRAFPFRAKELSLNRNPRGRALTQIRSDWYDLQREEGEEFDAFLFRREEFLSQFPTVTDVIAYEDMWQQIEIQFLLTRITATRERDLAYEENDFDKAQQIADDRETALEELHRQASEVIARRDVERYLATFAWPKTAAQQDFEMADQLKDLWFTLTGRGSPFTSREKGAISAYFRSLPVIQKYFPVEALDLADLSLDQRFAIMRRKDFWSTYFSLRDSKTQLDYTHMMKPELDGANRLLGLPPLEIIDIEPYPVESSGDPLFSHIQMMAALNRREEIEGEEQLTEEERDELEKLMAQVGLIEEDTAMTAEDVSRLLRPYTVEDAATP